MSEPLEERTSPEVASIAGGVLSDDNASAKEKTLAGSALSQAKGPKSPGEDMREIMNTIETAAPDDELSDRVRLGLSD